MYQIEEIKKELTIKKLLEFYDQEKIEGFCKNCENYNKIWSCPPHSFDPYKHLIQYNQALIIVKKINFDLDLVTKEDVMDIFQTERRKFSDELMQLECKGQEVLIAGNCYHCKRCTRLDDQPCILKDKMRYSLESLCLSVGDLCKEVGVELVWSQGGVAPYIVTVGAILKG